ncbi:hypothetical protein MKZ38_006936 [Zalerion maritima]|uniref:Fructose-bisphosphate aldolase n=1 Tax=Zalerion maritima TaxID=339359 RepID=A0AAD5WVP3_9PEZI|nr:hypothetical protein MKZ38_006936 [Zalerion maritima]
MAPDPGWKENNKTLKILRAAEKGGYGVVAPVAYNIETILGIIAAAEKKRSPLILLFFPWAITFSSGLLVRAAADAISRASVPISIHLDHAQDESLIRRAADSLPFDSIMIDMSHHETHENLAKTAELARYCHDRRIATEAEPGRIEGGEDGVAWTDELRGSLTTEEQVEDFIATGIDMLAPAFGNVHGEYGPKGPELDYDRLEMIRGKAAGRVHLVLHGTNSFTQAITRKCIAGGISKNNVNKLVLDRYLAHVRTKASTLPLTTLMEEGVEECQKLVEWQIDVCLSAGKA